MVYYPVVMAAFGIFCAPHLLWLFRLRYLDLVVAN